MADDLLKQNPSADANVLSRDALQRIYENELLVDPQTLEQGAGPLTKLYDEARVNVRRIKQRERMRALRARRSA